MSTAELQLDSSPFDSIAEEYDAVFSDSPIGILQRSSVWADLSAAFRSGERVLDIGCGTGVDACFLAQRGVSVLACDRSREMVRTASEKAHSLPGRPHDASVAACVCRAEAIATVEHDRLFDGAFSNFGVLNCVSDLRQFARDLASTLRPSARVLVCLMGPCCLWEVTWYLVHGQLRRALRRFRPQGTEARIGRDGKIKVHYPTARAIKRMFAPEFHLTGVKGVGLFVPPTYVSSWANRFPRFLRLASDLDRLLCRCPGIRILSDHILLTFERTRI